MEINYKFSDYYTLVSKTRKTFPIATACFADILEYGNVPDKVYLYIAKDINYGSKNNQHLKHNNTLTLKELHKLIKLTQSYCKFKCTVTQTNHDKEEFYKLSINFGQGLTRTTKLFILTALRYSYEFPFNVICKDAFKLCQYSKYKHKGFFNICNFIFLLFFKDRERTIHSLCETNTSFTKKSLLQERIVKADRVHDMFNRKICKVPRITEFDNKTYSQEFWDQKFEKRLKVYNQYINKF